MKINSSGITKTTVLTTPAFKYLFEQVNLGCADFSMRFSCVIAETILCIRKVTKWFHFSSTLKALL